MNIVRDDLKESYNYGDGLAFFLGNSDLSEPIEGGAMGLPIKTGLIRSFGSFVAVEFDTYFDDSIDSDSTPGPHVGININSLQSTAIEIWNCDITRGIEYEAWISYNSNSKNLSVIFTGYSVEKHTIKSWKFNSTLQIPAKKTNKKALVVGLTIGSIVLVGGLALLGFVLWKKRIPQEEDEEFTLDMSMDNEFEARTGPKKFSYGELFHATNNFAEDQKLGEGGFGGVYRGFLRESNSYVAVKRISNGSKQGRKEYAVEVKIISRLRHRNLVQLVGCCHNKRELLLVSVPGKWKLRLPSIQRKKLVDMGKKVQDRSRLGLSIVLSTRRMGTVCGAQGCKIKQCQLGLLITEKTFKQLFWQESKCLITSKANKESDVYNFEIVALEIACERKLIDLNVPKSQMRMVEWVWDLYGTGRLLDEAVDPKIWPYVVQEEMECLMMVGLWCAHPDHNLLPSIKQAIHVLNFEASLPILSTKMPVVTYIMPPVNPPSLVSCTHGSNTFSNSGRF
ncbi:hypothetical protein ACSBR2_021879 [Camellia fascicularis]